MSTNPVILSVIHFRQKILESTQHQSVHEGVKVSATYLDVRLPSNSLRI
jgi:hypothetical protein